jgi:hypothetical protein
MTETQFVYLFEVEFEALEGRAPRASEKRHAIEDYRCGKDVVTAIEELEPVR